MLRSIDIARRAIACARLAVACTVVELVPCLPADAADPGFAPNAVMSPGPTASPRTETAAADPCGGPARLLATLNRPTIGYSACAVPKGSVVLENGYQNTYQGGDAASVTAAYPQGFQRAGIADRFELDLIGPSFNRSRAGASLTTGYSDLGLGFKYELPQAGRFTYAIDGLFTAATGTGGFSNGEPSETIDADISYSLSPAIGVGTTLAASSTAGLAPSESASHTTMVTARYGTLNPSVVVTAQIPNFYQFYAELVGQTKIAPQTGGRIYTDFGVQKLLGPNLEVDLEYGVDFTPLNGSRFRYIGTGFGLRV